MPEINLLPWREKKRERDKREFIIMVCIALFFGAFIIILSNLYVSSLVDTQTFRNQMLQTEIDQLNKQIKDIKMLAKKWWEIYDDSNLDYKNLVETELKLNPIITTLASKEPVGDCLTSLAPSAA